MLDALLSQREKHVLGAWETRVMDCASNSWPGLSDTMLTDTCTGTENHKII